MTIRVDIPSIRPDTDYRKDTYQQFLDRVAQLYHDGVNLQAQRTWLGPHFNVFAHWEPPTLSWTLFDETLQSFSARVATTTRTIGRPPDETSDSVENVGTSVPWVELHARWKMTSPDGFKYIVLVRAMSATGCKIDPRAIPSPAVPGELHPECKQVLEHLTDLDPNKETA